MNAATDRAVLEDRIVRARALLAEKFPPSRRGWSARQVLLFRISQLEAQLELVCDAAEQVASRECQRRPEC